MSFEDDLDDFESVDLVPALYITDLYQMPSTDTLFAGDEDEPLVWINPQELANLVAGGLTITMIAQQIGVPARLLNTYYTAKVPLEIRREAEHLRADADRTKLMNVLNHLNLNVHKDAKLFIETTLKLMGADDSTYSSRGNGSNVTVNNNEKTNVLVIEDRTQVAKVVGDTIEGEFGVDDETDYLAKRYEEQRQRLLEAQS